MGPDKSAGPDGITARFLQTSWHVIGPELLVQVKKIFEEGVIPQEWLRCRVTLIPKTEEPQSPADFQPISVGNILYRLVMRIIASRLRPYLTKVISKEQNAFLRGRCISENIILVKEVLHSFSRSDFKHKTFMLKADINKAFDKLDWNFLERAMRYLNIPEKIISIMLSSFKRAKVTITINGQGDGFIQPTQGLRQGCPMSPYIFIIAMEVLSRWLQEAHTRGLLQGVRLAHTSPIITHSIYADDLILVGNTCRAEVDTMTNMLHKFGYVSGLLINPNKSKLWFSKKCDDLTMQRVQDVWRAERVQGDEKYLGILLSPNGDAKRNGIRLLEKIKQKLSGWKTSMLSHAGRLVLIKSVLMTMPVYFMSLEMLPKGVIKEINSLMAKFLWGKTGQNRYLTFIAWKKVCRPVDMGGLGVKDLESFGEALFLKLVWSLAADEDKPWVKICKAKYYPNVGFWRAKNVSVGSKMWRQIMSKKEFFQDTVMWDVQNGEKICALSQPWFQGWSVQHEASKHDRSIRVKELIDDGTGQWNMHELNRLFQPHQVQQILQENNKPITNENLHDRLIWKVAKNGKFTAREGYNELLQPQRNMIVDQHSMWEGWWKNKNITPRIKIFLWRLINKGLPMALHMHSRFPNFPPICQRCQEENEYETHCLFFCATSRQVWFASPLGIRVHELPMEIKAAVNAIIQGLDDYGMQLFVNTIWEVWKARNKAVIEHQAFKPADVLQKVQMALSQRTQSPAVLHTMHETIGRYEYYEDGWQIVIDASWDVTKKAGSAYIIYEQGILHSIGMHSTSLNDPFMAEAMAMDEAIKYVKDQIRSQPMAKVQFFSDCLNLVQAVNDNDFDQVPSWRATRMVNNIIRELQLMQHEVTLQHTRREAVQQAHTLANTARRRGFEYRGRPHWQLLQQEGIREEIDIRFFQRTYGYLSKKKKKNRPQIHPDCSLSLGSRVSPRSAPSAEHWIDLRSERRRETHFLLFLGKILFVVLLHFCSSLLFSLLLTSSWDGFFGERNQLLGQNHVGEPAVAYSWNAKGVCFCIRCLIGTNKRSQGDSEEILLKD
ncbi:hypothetical protein LUZ63_003930 [Rhynchospora breviuscula]|uniref:Reverse transcriptase domain-containing protein n=1 Tax=Rhynchospora breviuscula TaxID=2022672 RepID=A0A9Q0D1J7_9POAL|nr:hypothetical protein LUZ63_003930 [Rhynchospora breviuscula]